MVNKNPIVLEFLHTMIIKAHVAPIKNSTTPPHPTTLYNSRHSILSTKACNKINSIQLNTVHRPAYAIKYFIEKKTWKKIFAIKKTKNLRKKIYLFGKKIFHDGTV